ncbi:MAG: cytochrome P450 [Pseudomonadota bacterium]
MAKPAPIDREVTFKHLEVDPYAVYKRYRAETPIVTVAAMNRTLITRFDDVKHVKQNPQIFSSDDTVYSDDPLPMHRAMQAHTLMRKNGPEHARERGAMAPSYGAKAIRAAWSDVFQRIAAHYVGRLRKGDTVDLFSDLAAPFASRALCHLMGLRDVSDADMCRWSQALIDGSGNHMRAPEVFARSDAANAEINAEVDRMIPVLKVEPDMSALSVMINADDPLDHTQILANLKISIGGGLNEPRDAILTVLYGLLSNPEQWEAVVADHALLPQAFEEAVRWVAPIQIQGRVVAQSIEINGTAIPEGTTVMAIAASANHDEDYWDDPELYDAFRPRKPHHAFGGGPHFCQGTHVARAMVNGALMPALLDRFPKMELADPDPGFFGFAFRGPTRLHVKLN